MLRYFVIPLLLGFATPTLAGPIKDVRAEAKEARQQSKKKSKVKLSGDAATIDGVQVCSFRDDPARRGSYYLVDLQGNDVLYYRWIFEGDHNYFEAYRADNLDTLFYDTQAYVGYKKWTVESLHGSGVLASEGIDQAKLAEFAKKMGTEMTRARREAAMRH